MKMESKKTYHINVSGRFYQYFDVEAMDEEEARLLAEEEINPAECFDWDIFEFDVEAEYDD